MPGPSITYPAQARRARSSNGSIWGAIGHVLSGTGKGLYHGITGLPTGAYMTGRAIGHDISQSVLSHPGSAFNPESYAEALARGRTGKIAKNVAKQEYESYRHFGKGGDISGPLLDASAVFTGGSSLAGRTSKALSEVSKASQASRAARAAELATKDAAVAMAKGSGVTKGIGYDRAANLFKVTSSDLKKHARIYKQGLEEGNMSVGKPAGIQGKFANHPPHKVLKDPNHPLFDFYAERYPTNIGNATRLRKAFMQRPQYSRPLLKGAPLKKSRSGFYVPTSPNPLFRGVRKGVEQIRPERSANREISKEAVRRETTQSRFQAPKNIRVAKALTPVHPGIPETVLGAPMSLLRMAMWARPRYYLQNIAQTGQMLAANPVLTARSAALAKNLFKNNRDLYNTVRAVTGEAQAGALATGVGPGRLASKIGPKIPGRVGRQIKERGIQGAMGYAANIPESHVRLLSVLNELQKHNAANSLGALTPEKVDQFFGNVRRTGAISPEHLPLRRAVEEVGDFSRIYSKNLLRQRRPSEREFMQTNLPIFYPMFKALSRYGVRFPSEHAMLSAEGVALGKQGKKEQKRLLGPLPFWAQYLIPKSAGDPNAHRSPKQAVLNPANIYNLQPAADIGRQVAETTREGGPVPGLSLLQESGPTPGLFYSLVTGKDIQTGYPVKPFSKNFYKNHPGVNRSLINTPIDYLQGLPLIGLEQLLAGQKPHLRSFQPGNAKDRILQELIGPSVIPRQLKTKETSKQAKRENSYGKGRTKKKKSSYNS